MRHHQVLLGNNEDSLTLLLQAHYARLSPNTTFAVATTLDALIHHATRTVFDAAIVVLDNLSVPTNSPAAHMAAVLDALPSLQARGAMPVTAMAFNREGTDFVDRVREAGTDAFLLLPAEAWAIQAAFTAAFDNFVRRDSSGLAPVARLAASLIDAGYYDLELKLSERRDQIEFRVHHRPEELGRYLKQHSRVMARVLGTIRAAGFTRVGFEELGLEYEGDVVEGGFWVRPIEEVFAEHPESADDDDDDHKWWE
jgi:hypothetical protein